MLRLVLLVCLVAAAAAVPVESDTEFCNGQTECPQDCGYVSRNDKCIYCKCGGGPLVQPEPVPLPEPVPECQHGPAFIDECDNDCKCVRPGVYGCTRKLCMPGQTTQKPKSCSGGSGLPKRSGQRVSCHAGIVKVQSEKEKCLPGATFMDAEDYEKCLPGARFMDAEDCNSCMCSDSGVAGCTIKLCIREIQPLTEESDTEFCNGETECPQDCGLVYKDDKCVYCKCGGGPLVQPEPVPEPVPDCQHGPAFIDECDNDCKCVKPGVYGCTRKLCMPGQTPQKPKTCSGGFDLPKRSGQFVSCHDGIVKVQRENEKCLPGARFMDAEDCNSCMCSDSGVAGCTLKLCIREIQPLTDTGCKHGPRFIDECNNDCNCVDGRFYGCTRKLCMPGQKSEVPMKCSGSGGLPKRGGQRVFCHEGIVKVQKQEDKCLPGATFMDAEDCNSCMCSNTGQAGCTLKFCIPPPQPDKEPECQHGPAIIDECDNDCKCVKGGVYGCTRKMCMPGQTPQKPKTCSDAFGLPKRSGQRVSCHNGIVKVQSEKDKCLPGAVFMDAEDCNSCMCSNTGKAGCTLKLCIPPSQPEKEPGCPYGPGFIDQCNNDCHCVDGRSYGCTKKACKSGEQAEVPMKCSSSDNLPPRAGQHVFCDDGVVKLQKKEAGCEHGPGFVDQCNNDCHCVDGRSYGCTKKACKSGEQAEVPMKCSSSDNLPPRAGQHVFCDDGIVKVQQPEEGPCRALMAGAGAWSYAATGAGAWAWTWAGAAAAGSAVQSRCTVSASQPCPAGSLFVRFVGFTKVCGTAPSVCPHGKEFIDECGSDCRCLADGYACTKKACEQGQTAMKPMTCDGTKGLPERKGRRVFCHEKVVKVQDEAAACLPGAVFLDECNECFCTDGGMSGCTQKGCLGTGPTESTLTCKDGFPTCPQDCGQVYNPARDCYDCPCGVGGPGDVIAEHGDPCPPGTVFSDSGAFFKSCKPSDKCPHGLEFIDECGNDCRCTAGGYGCTLKGCQPGQTGNKPLSCQGSGQLPDRKGKRVFCHEGIVKTQAADAGCVPGSVFKDDCNSCFCGENGSAGCTFKACPKPEPEACEHGSSFIDECDNDCECMNNKFYGCTRKACKPGETSQKPKTCEGAADLPERSGRRVMCHEGIVKTQAKDEQCLPGSVYKDSCNTCTCGGGCTYKACLT